MFITQHIHQGANVKAWNGYLSILYLHIVVVVVVVVVLFCCGGGSHHCRYASNVAVSMQLPDSRMLGRSARNSRKWVKLDLLI